MSYLDRDSEDAPITLWQVPIFLAASAPMLIFAISRVLGDYMSTGAAEKRVWLFYFFPVLFGIAIKPWLMIAVPVAFTFAARSMVGKGVIGVIAIIATFAAFWLFKPDRTYPYDPTLANSMSVAGLAVGIWALDGLVALILALRRRPLSEADD